MQNVQNADIQRVMNLVDLYRTKVGKESKIAKAAKKEYESMSEIGIWGEGTHTEIWKKHLMVNEQLLGHFYAVVAGENAEKDILDQLLPEIYDKTIFGEEEETFLASHFKELVNYIILTPCDDSLEWVHRFDEKDVYTITKEVLELIKSRVEIPVGSKVYYPNTMFAQLANLFDGCKYFCDTMSYAWTRVAVYANGIDAVENANPTAYDVIMSYLPKGDDESKTIARLYEAYKNLPIGGKLVLICPSDVLMDKGNTSYEITHSPNPLKRNKTYTVNYILEEVKASADANAQFRQMLVEDKGIKEIIQLPQVMSKNTSDAYCLLIAEKGRSESDVILIDACVASNDFDTKHYILSFDNIKFNTILQNDGIDSNTGLRKVVKVPSEELSPKILIPQLYVIERPSETEHPIPLANICTLETTAIRSLRMDLPMDTPWIKESDLSYFYKGELDVTKLEKAECPNNPPHTKEYAFDGDGRFSDHLFSQRTPIGRRVQNYRACTYVDGKSDIVLYKLTPEDGVCTALLRATGHPVAISSGISVFCPKNGFEALSLLALLRQPIVYRQILAYKDYGLTKFMDEIFVPTDKRIICDEKNKLLKDGAVLSELDEKLVNIRKSVRMRKHALTQSLSSIEAVFYALNSFRNRKGGVISDDDVISRREDTTVKEAFDFISKGINNMMPALEHIADVEYTFAMPKWIDPEKFMEEYIATNRKGWLNFEPIITWKKGHNQAKEDIYERDSETGMPVRDMPPLFLKGDSFEEFVFPKDALRRIFNNIVSNAQAHGFTEETRKDYKLKFSWRSDETGLFIEIENNGTPIPTDRDTSSLIEYGVSTALHHDGHNGIGCNEIDDIMRRYDGDVHIISSPDSEYTVKYVLRFKQISTPILS